MKKYFLTVSAAVMLMACGAKQSQNVAYDLAFYGLKGDVKKMDKIEFDQNGKITLVDGKNLFELETPQRSYNEETGEFTDVEKWTRDDKGRIISQRAIEYEQIYVWEGSQIVRDTTYCEGQIFLTNYEYDKDGNRVKNTTIMCQDNGKFEFEPCNVIEFTYKEFDSHNNWTKCTVKNKDAVTGEATEEELSRKIEYWK
jgi:hypothetical protein